MVPQIVPIKVEPLTQAAFEPFGEVLAIPERPPDYGGIGSTSWVVGFKTEGRVQVRVMRCRYQGLRFSKLERHFAVTQSFYSAGGAASVIAMAPPTDPDDRSALPRPEDMRAFLVDASKGYVMRAGTWHTLDRFPIHPPHSDFLMLTDWETTFEVKQPNPDKEKWRLNQEVDFEARFDTVFEFTF